MFWNGQRNQPIEGFLWRIVLDFIHIDEMHSWGQTRMYECYLTIDYMDYISCGENRNLASSLQ